MSHILPPTDWTGLADSCIYFVLFCLDLFLASMTVCLMDICREFQCGLVASDHIPCLFISGLHLVFGRLALE